MIAYGFMIVGGAMVLCSVIGFLKFLFQPLVETYQVVIKREDDYAHYTSPTGIAYLNEHKKKYLILLAVLFVAGSAIFSAGLYMRFGSRGFEMLLSPEAAFSQKYDAVDSELAEGFDEDGNYIAENGKIYSYYVKVKGNEVYYGDKLIGNADDFREYVTGIDKNTRLYLIDAYASSATYHEVMSLLEENGIKCDKDE